MGYLTNEIFQKPTLVSVLAMVGIVVGIPFGIYELQGEGGSSLGGVLLLIYVFVLFILLVVDRGLVFIIKPLKLSLIELVLGICYFLYYQYDNRKVIIDLQNYKQNYFVVIYNNGSLKNSTLTYSLFFNVEAQVRKNCAVLPARQGYDRHIKILMPENWKALSEVPDSIANCHIEFYNSDKQKFDEREKLAIAAKLILENKIHE
jgi:hypothetical protein